MSRLEELLQTICPDGVEYKELEEIAFIGTGDSNRVDAEEGGEYPFFVRSKQVMRSKKFSFDEEAIIIPGEGGIGEIFHYINGKYDLHQRAYRISFKDNKVNTKFAYYYLISNFKKFILMKAVTATVISIRRPMIASFLLPLPPLPIQEEIVRILDTFTALEAELENQLEAELAARTQQYEHYRNYLLINHGMFDDVPHLDSMPVHSLKEVCLPVRNIRWNENRGKTFRYIDLTSTDRDTKSIQDTAMITSENAPSRAQQIVRVNDVIFGSTRPTLKRYAFITDEFDGEICSTGFCVLRSNPNKILPKYLYFQVSSTAFEEHVEKYQRGSAYPAISDKDLKSFKITVPPLEVQEQTVSILDRFDTLVNDLKSGLPAEIALRRKQYEYYRDKLLTFTRRA